MKQFIFETGKRYYMTSACDHDCRWTYEVVKRTASTVTLQAVRHDGTMSAEAPKTCRIDRRYFEHTGEETVKPLGSYSMAPVLSARRAA